MTQAINANDLVERYVKQVGRHLPDAERKDVISDLRSQIQDQLDDRFGGRATHTDAARVLSEFGDPGSLAIKYGAKPYLIGPELYPGLITTLRVGLMLIPALTVPLKLIDTDFGLLRSNVIQLFIQIVAGAAEGALVFTGAMVLLFAILQHQGVTPGRAKKSFDPLSLPLVNHPGTADRFGTAWGLGMDLFGLLMSVYWLVVGGLSLRVDLTNPGTVVPTSMPWLIALIGSTLVSIVMHVLAIVQPQRGLGYWLTQLLVELFSVLCLYFVLFLSLDRLLRTTLPTGLSLWSGTPEAVAAVCAAVCVLVAAPRLFKLWAWRRPAPVLA
jgi:hypothetical protein